MSPNVADVTLGLLAGAVLGAAVFGILWYAVDRIAEASVGRLAVWVLGGFLVRSAMVLGVLLALAPRGAPTLVAVAVGATMVRFGVTGAVAARGRRVQPWS